MFKRTAAALNMSYVGEIAAKAYNVGDVLQDQQALLEIEKLAGSLT
jgi:hypothetical protein